MTVSIIITAYKEEKTIKITIEHILQTDKKILEHSEIIVVAPDQKTLTSAKATLQKHKFKNYLLLQDKAKGKAAALNLAYKKANGDMLVFTDGDMYVDKKAIPELIKYISGYGGVSGHPVSLDDRKTMFGFFSHLHCHLADINRMRNKYVPMSGYLFAIEKIKGIFPIPEELRAEDAYISSKITESGYKINYAKSALAYVHFPKNTSDWLKQKTRSLGGNYQLKNYVKSIPTRNIFEDILDTFNVILYARNIKEVCFVIYLYLLRLVLWMRILRIHYNGGYSKGSWERIESTKDLNPKS